MQVGRQGEGEEYPTALVWELSQVTVDLVVEGSSFVLHRANFGPAQDRLSNHATGSPAMSTSRLTADISLLRTK
jgi:hypothetical protein